MAPALIAAYSTEHRSGHERRDERFWHDNAREQKRAAKTEVDQTRDETAPVIRELLANQKDECNSGYYSQRDRQPSSCLIHTEYFV